MLRSMIILMLGIAVTGYVSACCIIFGLISPGENKIHHMARIWAKILLLLSSTRVKVVGAENVLIGKPQIFMSNHQSDFDILVVLGFVPGQFRWIAKKELFKIPVFGGAMRNARPPEGKTSAREQGDSKAPASFCGTDNPRHLRVIQAVTVRPIPREHLDAVAGCANGPDLVAELRRRGLDMPCTRTKKRDRNLFDTCREV